MVAIMPRPISQSITNIVQRIIDVGEVSRHEHLQLASALLADTSITQEQRRQINKVFDYVKAGRLKLTD